MKKVLMSIRNRFALLFLTMLAAITTFAQDDGSIYDVKAPKHVFNVYSKGFPILLFGVVILFLGYISYRYWKDNRADDDISHTPHHQ